MIKYNQECINMCMKYDELMDPTKGLDHTNYSKIKKDMTDKINTSVVIPVKLIQKYNICTILRNIVDKYKENEEKINMYTKKQYLALKNGKTLHYYMGSPNDVEFISSIKNIIDYL